MASVEGEDTASGVNWGDDAPLANAATVVDRCIGPMQAFGSATLLVLTVGTTAVGDARPEQELGGFRAHASSFALCRICLGEL